MRSDSDRTELLRAAQWHFKQGHHLILLYGPHTTTTADGSPIPERDRGKRPVRTGFRRAGKGELIEHIRAGGNVGWLLGEHLVVDVDTGAGKRMLGTTSLQKLAPSLAPTRTVRTGSGGKHIQYALPSGHGSLRKSLPEYPGIDFLSGRHYVVIEGSAHRSGGLYELEVDAPLAEAPPALLELLGGRTESLAGSSQDGPEPSYSRDELEWLMVPLPNDDVDYDDWLAVGMALHFELGDDGLDLWDNWSAKSDKYDPADLRRRWESFGRTPSTTPRTGGTIEILSRRWHGRGRAARTPTLWSTSSAEGEPRRVTKALAHFLGSKPISDDGAPEPVAFNVQGWFQCGQQGMLAAEGGVGKTTWTLNLFIDIALGLDWCGHPVRAGRCWLLSRDDAQDDLEAVLRELIAARALNERDSATVRERVRVLSFVSVEKSTLLQPASDDMERTDFARELLEELAKDPELRFVAIDTARQFAGAEMNFEMAGVRLMGFCASLAQCEARPTVMVLTHLSKAVARARVVDSHVAIGSSAWGDNSRFLILLQGLSAPEVEELVLPPGFVLPADYQMLRAISTRGSLRVKRPEPEYLVRSEFGYRHVPVRRKSEGEKRDDFYERVATQLRAHPEGLTKNTIVSVLGGRRVEVLEALDVLIAEGRLVLEDGPRRAHVLRLGGE